MPRSASPSPSTRRASLRTSRSPSRYSPFWDARVIETVRQFQFKPGTVDNQPTPVDMNLTVNITR